MLKVCLLSLLAAALWLSGCGNQQLPSDTAPSRMPTHAQPRLQTMKLWLGAEEIVAELALTPVQQQTGMMFRTNMDENAGMLFPLDTTRRASFWMTNCPLPLSAAYIDPAGVIREIHDLQPFNPKPVESAQPYVRFVLETRQGWFRRHNVREGMIVRTERGPLMQVFFPGQ